MGRMLESMFWAIVSRLRLIETLLDGLVGERMVW